HVRRRSPHPARGLPGATTGIAAGAPNRPSGDGRGRGRWHRVDGLGPALHIPAVWPRAKCDLGLTQLRHDLLNPNHGTVAFGSDGRTILILSSRSTRCTL